MKQLTRKTTIGILIILILLSVCFVGSMVWGKTLRISRANHDLTAGRTAAARKTYEDLAVDLPESPFVLHNLGLTAYQEEKYQPAADYFQKALEKLKKLPGSNKAKKELTAKCHYHLGKARFKLAEASKSGKAQTDSATATQATALYGGALSSFRSAIEANPADPDAKYNYELTKLRLDESQQQKQQNQDQKDQKQKDQKQKKQKQDGQPQNQPGRQNQSGQDQKQGSNQKNNRTNSQEQKSQSQGQNNQKRGMTKQEAQALLNAAENGDQYMAPIIRDDSSVQKDW
jgi:Ca-activated chloride channel family protein